MVIFDNLRNLEYNVIKSTHAYNMLHILKRYSKGD